jgi:hypothetical protein
VTPALPAGLSQSLRLAAGELGMCGAAWLFVEQIAGAGSRELVAELRNQIGREFPVLDAVADQFLGGRTSPVVDAARLPNVCLTARRLVVVGLEARHLDALLGVLDPSVEIAILCHSAFPVDWERVVANFGGRVKTTDLTAFQGLAGPRSALLTFAYGLHDAKTFVLPAWERVMGDDVRTQFRALVAWDVLGGPFVVYPRWLVEVPVHRFTHLVA